jgi:hypothetical protein
MDEAVMEDAVPPVPRATRPVITVTPQPFEHSCLRAGGKPLP